MKATEFEFRHQTLLHLIVVGAAFSTYLVDPVDIVWAVVGHRPNARFLERLCFALATALIGAGALLCTAAVESEPVKIQNGEQGSGIRPSGHIGSVLFSAGVASLAPFPGAVILLLGEFVLALRLILLERSWGREQDPSAASPTSWLGAIREESAKWGIFVTMVVFTWLLIDRVAEYLAIASLLMWAALNCKTVWSRATR
ncbi:MAG: hypothetical protein ACLP07_01665 [Terracidiphilus sp.]